MKLLKILAMLVLPLLIMQSCEKAEFEVQVDEGGLIEVKTPALNYVVGNTGPYEAAIRIYQGEIKTEKVDVYLTFYSTRPDTVIATGEVVSTQLISNTAPFTTITPTSLSANSMESFSFDFSDISGALTIETEVYPDGLTAADVIKGATNTDFGNTLPTSDGDYKIGDSWVFTYHVTTSDGKTVVQSKQTKATVSTRYAGIYNIVTGYYFGPEGLRDGAMWVGGQISIESVDATTYSWASWGAQFYSNWDASNGNNFYFQVDPATDIITYLPDQLLNGNPVLTPYDNPTDLTQAIPLAGPGMNTATKDDVEGKDQLNMCYGYFYAGSGPREFYFFLEKVVN